jgi:chemosensory pili system protein ChpA (sensor histidine kinase/response regulator)
VTVDPAERRQAYILVVEDDPDLRALHAEILEDAGHAVRSARDGVEALEVIDRDGAPAVIVLDLRMPRMNGWDLAERLSRRHDLGPISIVVVAAHYQIREQAKALGAQAWLHKPVSIDDLARVVGRCYDDALGRVAS